MTDETVDVLVVGAGPAGLAAAIACSRSGLSYRILEKGTLVNSIYGYPRNMVFFTTPELLEIGGIPFTTPYEKPTRAEALRYYRRVADLFGLDVLFDERVESISPTGGFPAGDTGFVVGTCSAGSLRRSHRSRYVVMATGYYDNPNRLGIPGENLPHVSHYYTEPHSSFRKDVVVVGGRNSAAEAALDLYRSGARVTLVHRGTRLSDSIKYWVRPDIENRIKEGSIRALLDTCVTEIRPENVVVDSAAGREELAAQAVFLLTGYHPDVKLLASAGVRICADTLEPEHNAETLETNVRGLFLAGSVVAGKDTNRVFIENGRFHGEQIVRTICSRRSG